MEKFSSTTMIYMLPLIGTYYGMTAGNTANSSSGFIILGDRNTLCYELNGILLDNKESCMKANSKITNQESSAKFQGSESSGKWPKGCYMNDLDKYRRS